MLVPISVDSGKLVCELGQLGKDYVSYSAVVLLAFPEGGSRLLPGLLSVPRAGSWIYCCRRESAVRKSLILGSSMPVLNCPLVRVIIPPAHLVEAPNLILVKLGIWGLSSCCLRAWVTLRCQSSQTCMVSPRAGGHQGLMVPHLLGMLL